ncbi:MAG: hypothetical protein HKM07_06340 [Chlamydiae bacterium]|nr:hypothetical protein [Chlamydiota bacterium]
MNMYGMQAFTVHNREYSVTNNPFIYGITRETFEETDFSCGITTLGQEYHYLSDTAVVAYYSGRALAFLFSVGASIVDYVVQIPESVAACLEFIMIKLEAKVRDQDPFQTFSKKLFRVFSLRALCSNLREYTTRNHPAFVAGDLGFECSTTDLDLSGQLSRFLYQELLSLQRERAFKSR